MIALAKVNLKIILFYFYIPSSLVVLSKLIKDPKDVISRSNFSSDLVFSASKSKVPSGVNTGLVTTPSEGRGIMFFEGA